MKRWRNVRLSWAWPLIWLLACVSSRTIYLFGIQGESLPSWNLHNDWWSLIAAVVFSSFFTGFWPWILAVAVIASYSGRRKSSPIELLIRTSALLIICILIPFVAQALLGRIPRGIYPDDNLTYAEFHLTITIPSLVVYFYITLTERVIDNNSQ